MDRVVKCNNNQCEKHFMYTKIDTKCPFCHTEYDKVAEKPKEKPKEKKEATRTQKKSLKIWRSN